MILLKRAGRKLPITADQHAIQFEDYDVSSSRIEKSYFAL